ncbi:MAG TPA: hypothetical protein VGB19_11345 [Actinomycetota bacterium]
MVVATMLVLAGVLLAATIIMVAALRSRLNARREPEANRFPAALVGRPAPPVEDPADARHRRAS